MREMPYWKFYPSEWFMGDIELLSPVAKGVFIELCALYWHKNADMELDEKSLAVRMRIGEDTLRSALGDLKECFSITPDKKIVIKFLDEQRQEFMEVIEKKIQGGKKGAHIKALQKMRLNPRCPQGDLQDTLDIKIKIKNENEIKKESKSDNESKSVREGEPLASDQGQMPTHPHVREKSFKTWTLDDFLQDVGKWALEKQMPETDKEKFIAHFAEKSASGRMKFQMEKTWETSKRITKWLGNGFGKTCKASIAPHILAKPVADAEYERMEKSNRGFTR